MEEDKENSLLRIDNSFYEHDDEWNKNIKQQYFIGTPTPGNMKMTSRWSRRWWVVFGLWSLMVSATGGLLLVWWTLEYHRYNSQLWMVPLGLILSGTPVVVCFSLFASHFLISSATPHPTTSLLKVEPKVLGPSPSGPDGPIL